MDAAIKALSGSGTQGAVSAAIARRRAMRLVCTDANLRHRALLRSRAGVSVAHDKQACAADHVVGRAGLRFAVEIPHEIGARQTGRHADGAGFRGAGQRDSLAAVACVSDGQASHVASGHEKHSDS